MKRLLAFLLVFALTLCLFTGCGDNKTSPEYDDNDDLNDSYGDNTDPGEEPDETVTGFGDANVSYVMIYNPDIYNPDVTTNKKLSTGDIRESIDIDINRGEGLPLSPDYEPFDQGAINKDFPGITPEVSRGDVVFTTYAVGDTREFFCYNSALTARTSATFNCRYAGENCYVWVYDDSLSDTDAAYYGQAFDDTIYSKTTGTFGEHRYAQDGGKIHIMFYPFRNGTAGFFCNYDLFLSTEVSEEEVNTYGINTDHAIININTLYSSQETTILSTLGHEFQHLICFSDAFETRNFDQTQLWFNESMSGYIEEELYSGSKEDSTEALHQSNRVRYGQSLYNFDTDGISDYGVYGGVYYFSRYLAAAAGKDVFQKYHTFWRNATVSNLTTAKALYESVSSSFRSDIDDSISYPSSYRFASEEELWLSKLTLDYYVTLLSENASLDPYDYLNTQNLLYDTLDAANIEGGGRIIMAVKDGSFEIPEDAADGLVYVGFDENFNVIDYICK